MDIDPRIPEIEQAPENAHRAPIEPEFLEEALRLVDRGEEVAETSRAKLNLAERLKGEAVKKCGVLKKIKEA